MNNPFLTSTDQFLSFFEFPPDVYCEIQNLSGNAVGFLVKRDYPSRFRYRPPKDDNGRPLFLALLRIQYIRPNELPKPVTEDRVPILANAFICPRDATSIDPSREKDRREPVDLEFDDDFFFDHKRRVFYDTRGNTCSGQEMLERMYEAHCDTARFWPGLWFRTKVRGKNGLEKIIRITRSVLIWFIETFLGREVKSSSDLMKIELGGPKRPDLPKSEPATAPKAASLTVFGYEAPFRLIMTFCGTVLLAYSYAYFALDHSSNIYLFLKALFSNAFLSLTAGIMLLSVLDVVLPSILVALINWLDGLQWKLMWKKVRFR